MNKLLFSQLGIVLTAMSSVSNAMEIPEMESGVSPKENDWNAQSKRATEENPNRIVVDLMNVFWDNKIHRKPLSELESLADGNSALPQYIRDIAKEIMPDVTDDTIREILKGIYVDMSKPCVMPSRKLAPKKSVEEVIDDCKCILF